MCHAFFNDRGHPPGVRTQGSRKIKRNQVVPVAGANHGVDLTAEVLVAHVCGEFGREIVYCRLRNKWVLDE